MTKRLKNKLNRIAIIGIVVTVILGIFIYAVQTKLTTDDQKDDLQNEIITVEEELKNTKEERQKNIDSFDEFYQSKADSLAFLLQKDKDVSYSDFKEMMNVDYLCIMDTDSNIIEGDSVEFTNEDKEKLKAVFNGEEYEPYDQDYKGTTSRYYATKIDDSREVVIVQNIKDLTNTIKNNASTASTLSKTHIGIDGFMFAVKKDGTIVYYPQSNKIDKNLFDNSGLESSDLQDGYYGKIKIYNQSYIASIHWSKANNMYLIGVIPASEVTGPVRNYTAIQMFILVLLFISLIVYGVSLLNDEEKNGQLDEHASRHEKFFVHSHIKKRIMNFSIILIVLIFGSTYYLQSLFSLSQASMINAHNAEQLSETIKKNDDQIQNLREIYNTRYLRKAKLVSYILSNYPDLENREDMKELSKINGLEYIMVYDMDGKERTSDSSYVNFEISDDPDDQSYEFQRMKNGAEYYIQEAQDDEIEGKYSQYIAYTMVDDQGNPTGFIQICSEPDEIKEVLHSTQLGTVLGNVSYSNDGFAFGVEDSTDEFLYFPDDSMMGNVSTNYGFKDEYKQDGFNNFITLNGKSYFVQGFKAEDHYKSSTDTNVFYIYVAIPQSEIGSSNLWMTLWITLASLIALAFVDLFILTGPLNRLVEKKEEDGEKENIQVIMPDGTIRHSLAAADRWNATNLTWKNKSAVQRSSSVFSWAFGLMAIFITISILFKDQIYQENSILLYVIEGNWEKGLNIFAFTSCIMIICVVRVVVLIVRWILSTLSVSLNARGETICRMLRNGIKYISFFVILYFCLAQFGIDTKTLVASIGIFSLVVGLGAKDLIADILAGLFVIFESEFQVGDIVDIGGWRGTVEEIGFRTTKVVDASGDVKIISNSQLVGVVNATKQYSSCLVVIGIEYEESLEHVENILSQELPKMKKKFPEIVDGPFYQGVVELAADSVNIRIAAKCAEKDRGPLQRKLNRELKLIFDKNNINIPYAQIVVNQPVEHGSNSATFMEQYKAEAYSKEQQELSKDIKEE